MKKKLLRTFLLAAALLAGESVWAETIIYDFSKISESNLTSSGEIAGYAIKTNYCWPLYTPKELSSELNGQFAFNWRENSNNTNTIKVSHSDGGLYIHHDSGRDETFAITNLQAGDVVTITIESGKAYFYSDYTNATYDNNGTETTPAVGDSFVSNTSYKIKGDGNLDLTTSKNDGNFVISKVVIERPYTRVWGMNFLTLGKDVCAVSSNDNTTLTRTSAFDSYYNLSYETIAFNSNFGVNDNDAWKIRYKAGSSQAVVGLWSYNAAGTMAIRNLPKNAILTFWSAGNVSAGLNAKQISTLSGTNYYTFQITNAGVATFTPTKSSYIYSVGVYTSTNEIIGLMDNSTDYGSSIRGTEYKALSISRNQKIKINFNNHGSGVNNWNNWALRIANDTYDRALAGGNHINKEGSDAGTDNAYDGVTQKWYIDGVDNYNTFMEAYKTQMQNANVDMTIKYNDDGTLSVTTDATMDGHDYQYVFTRDIAFSGDVTMKLGVDCAWLELLSVSKVNLYTATFTANAGEVTPAVAIYSDAERTKEVINGDLEDGSTYYFTATADGYRNYEGSFTVNGAAPAESFTMLPDATVISYIFKDLVAAGKTLRVESSSSSISGYTTVCLPTDATNLLGGRLAFQFRGNSTNQWNIKNTDDKKGLVFTGNYDEHFTVVGLKKGDKFTLTVGSGQVLFTTANCTGKYIPYNGGNYYTEELTTGTPTTWAELQSGTEYTVNEDGYISLQAKKSETIISSIVIETAAEETLTSPTIVAVADGEGYNVTITPGVSNVLASVKTYYTIDGSTPTSASTLYTGAISINNTTTIKAITISGSSVATESSVAEETVTVGTVAEPRFTIGSYNYEQGGYAITPICETEGATLTYTLGGGDATPCTVGVPFYAKGGKVIMTATKAGWKSATTASNNQYELNVAPSSESPETLIAFNTSSDNGDKNIDHVYKSVTIFGGSSGPIAGIDGDNSNGIKLRTSQNSNTLTMNINPGYIVTKVSLTAKSNNTGATIDLISTTIDGGSNIMVSNTTFPKSSETAVEYSTGAINATSSIVFTFDNSNITGENGKKNKQILATITVWYAQSVSKTISAAGWATYCSPCALDLSGASSELTNAYIVTGGADGKVKLVSVKESTVPANTGLLLKGSGDVTIPLVASSSTDVTSNKLVGVTASEILPAEGGYVLMGSPSIGFYKNSDAFTLGDNTAYLPADFDGIGARTFFSFDDDATAIKIVDVEAKEDSNVYNLTGLRVAQPKKGMFILNGKKVIIK